jgi:hypothetical protein
LATIGAILLAVAVIVYWTLEGSSSLGVLAIGALGLIFVADRFLTLWSRKRDTEITSQFLDPPQNASSGITASATFDSNNALLATVGGRTAAIRYTPKYLTFTFLLRSRPLAGDLDYCRIQEGQTHSSEETAIVLEYPELDNKFYAVFSGPGSRGLPGATRLAPLLQAFMAARGRNPYGPSFQSITVYNRIRKGESLAGHPGIVIDLYCSTIPDDDIRSIFPDLFRWLAALDSEGHRKTEA